MVKTEAAEVLSVCWVPHAGRGGEAALRGCVRVRDNMHARQLYDLRMCKGSDVVNVFIFVQY